MSKRKRRDKAVQAVPLDYARRGDASKRIELAVPAWLRSERLQHGVALGFLTLVVVITWLLQMPATVVDMNSDMHAICAIVAVREDPGRYAEDSLLNDPSRFAKYTPAYVWVVQQGYRLLGSFPAVTHAMVLPTGLLFVIGTYWLIWRLMGGKLVAVAIALALGMSQIWFELGEKWSMLETWGTMPRTQYTALFPWLLLAAWEWRHRVKLWPVIAGFAAALVYVHPVSAPPIGFAIWWALLLGTGDAVKWKPRLKWAGISAAAAVVVAMPTLASQLAPRLQGVFGGATARVAHADPNLPPEEAAARQEFLFQLSKERFSPGLMDLRVGYERIWDTLRGKNPDIRGGRYNHFPFFVWGILWAVAGIGVGLTEKSTRYALLLLLIATLAFSIPTVWVPLVESIHASEVGEKPHLYDLARGFRWWPLGLMLIGATGFGALRSQTRWSPTVRVGASWALTLVAVPTVFVAYWQPINAGAGRLWWGGDAQQALQRKATHELVGYIRENTPKDAAFVIPREQYWLRHTPGRPVVHSWKEGSTFSRNYELAKPWHERMQQQQMFQAYDQQFLSQYAQLQQSTAPEAQRRAQLRELAAFQTQLWHEKLKVWRSWGAEYAFQPRWTVPVQAEVAFSNDLWAVVKIPMVD